MDLSIVIPARNEAEGLRSLLPSIAKVVTGLSPQVEEFEIIVVDDGSTDDTAGVSRQCGAKVVSHPYSIGNGAAIKSGARIASGQIIVFMDGDGQHDPADIPRLLEPLSQGYEMVVGARHVNTHASHGRRFANFTYNRLASLMTGHRISDLTSGYRAVRARHFRKFLYLLPNGFSYPTTSTMAFFRSGFPVCYIPIQAHKRSGTSKIRVLHDGSRFLIIIIKIGALFSPMRLFLPVSAILFSVATGYYLYTYISFSRFTNMSALLFISSLIVFLMGILSEQISSLHYRGLEETRRRIRR